MLPIDVYKFEPLFKQNKVYKLNLIAAFSVWSLQDQYKLLYCSGETIIHDNLSLFLTCYKLHMHIMCAYM